MERSFLSLSQYALQRFLPFTAPSPITKFTDSLNIAMGNEELLVLKTKKTSAE
jgi:hypothetical protein